ncbi:MAG: M28 family metallopeptidase [Emcibacter sp.]|nr:M28 family metallopeptidase [Emcibacter sp.]
MNFTVNMKNIRKNCFHFILAGTFCCQSIVFGSFADDESQARTLEIPVSTTGLEQALDTIKGYSADSSKVERQLEEKYYSLSNPEELRKIHRYLTSEPHPAGSKRTKEIVDYMAKSWKENGLDDVIIHRYDALISEPVHVKVEMVAPYRYVPSLKEAPYPEDPDTNNSDLRGAWLAFSASGKVTAPVIYANSGNPADYDHLREKGIDPRGKIVVVRYSDPYSYRGFKALTAEREGVAAMIIYSDPAEDGYKKGKVFPEGPWGPESHLQRGSIAYDFIVPGDPLTPGLPSVLDTKRIPIEEAISIPKVIAVPMSYKDIKPILEKLGGPKAPESWQGGLPITYNLGGSEVILHMDVKMKEHIKPHYVVEGRIYGSDYPDEWIVMGNHHDAWGFGGVDPVSGTSSMMEMTRNFGQMKKDGWRPKRSLVFCSWDGEEFTLTGSTEWGEEFAEELKKKVVAYINVDSAVAGPNLKVEAVGSLAPMIVELTKNIRDPNGDSLYTAWRRSTEHELDSAEDIPQDANTGEISDDALINTRIGSGSDHTVFLNFLGRPVIEMYLDGDYGVYHSIYDNHYWMNKIGDPGFKYHKMMVQLWGTIALRLANSDILPLDFETYTASIQKFLTEIKSIDSLPENLDLTELMENAQEMQKEAQKLNRQIRYSLDQGQLDSSVISSVNEKLMQFELNWLNPEGIPGRPWFKHTLYAPRYTYAAMILPGITEAAEQKDWETARTQADIVAQMIAKNIQLIQAATKVLQQNSVPNQ